MIAEIDDRVLYIGYASSSYYQDIMKKYLDKGFWYTIKNIFLRYSVYNYEFVETSACAYSYPSESFILDNKKYMKDKYNLK